MRRPINGGAGFIGSHLAESALTKLEGGGPGRATHAGYHVKRESIRQVTCAESGKHLDDGVRHSSDYIPTLDGWRAIAILLVLACHSRDGLFGINGILPVPWLNALLVHGAVGVAVFFGISGFLITSRLLDEYHRDGRINLRSFYWRRFFRILPASWTYLAIISLFALAGAIVVFRGELASCLFFFRNYREDFGWYTGQFWSLAVEEYFYLLWPVTLALLAPMRARIAACLAALVIGVWRHWDGKLHLTANLFPHGIPEHRTDTMLDALLWACVIAISFPTLSRFLLRTNLGKMSTAILALLLAVCGLAMAGTTTPYFSTVKAILIPLMIASTVIFPEGWIGRFLEFPSIRFVGKISYSLYLWQQPFLILDSASANNPSFWQRWPLAPVCVIGCAIASYYFVERPMILAGRHLRVRFKKPAQVATSV